MTETAAAVEKQPVKKEKTIAEKYFAELYGDGKLTRVPVAHLYFKVDDQFDFSEISVSQKSNLECKRFDLEKGRYFVCDFIPAWQVFELTWVAGVDSPPTTTMLPTTHVRRWKRGGVS